MREILFRGKRIDNGEWVEGGYYVIPDGEGGAIHRIAVSDCERFEYNDVVVDPSSISEFTGLTDKNGKKIFENDIVLCAESLGMAYREIRGKVVYKLTGFVVNCGDFNTTLSGGLSQTPYYVIGNIHDNPELLEDKP